MRPRFEAATDLAKRCGPVWTGHTRPCNLAGNFRSRVLTMSL